MENNVVVVAQHEVRIASLERKMETLSAKMEVIDTKLDIILSYASMAQGAGWILFRVGGWLMAVVSGVYALYTNWPHIFRS